MLHQTLGNAWETYLNPFHEHKVPVHLDPQIDIEPYRVWWAPVEVSLTIGKWLGYGKPDADSQTPLAELIEIPEFYRIHGDTYKYLMAVLISAVLWTLLDQMLKRIITPTFFGKVYNTLSSSDRIKWDNYVISSIHAALVSIVSTLVCFI